MVFCPRCQCDVEQDTSGSFACCVSCGTVLDEGGFASDLTFAKGADGEGEVVGQFVSETGQPRGLSRISNGRVYGISGEPHELAEARGRTEISHIVDHFSIRPGDHAVEGAHRLYKVALGHGFTRGRRVSQVAASCLYIFCREEQKPFMLIDFSDYLQVNVYALGAVYLQLIKLLHLEDHPTFTKPIDPSLYVHRFADRLNLGRKMNLVANKTLSLITSMKRDWMQTGRRPSGICGAALYIACHACKFERTKWDIIQVIHIGWDTLDKRLKEFAETQAAELTADEFDEHAKDFEAEMDRIVADKEKGAADSSSMDHLEGFCEHIMSEQNPAAHFDCGMCKACYVDYLKVSGGSLGTTKDPPAFTRGLRKEQKRADANADAKAEVLAIMPAEACEAAATEQEAAETLQEMEAVLSNDLHQALVKVMEPVATASPPALPTLASASRAASGIEVEQQEGPSTSQAATQAGILPVAPADSEEPASKRPRLEGGVEPLPDMAAEDTVQAGHSSPRRPLGSSDAAVGQPGGSQEAAGVDPESGALVPVNPEPEEPQCEPLDDMDDDEIDSYMLTEEEAALKTAAWEAFNADWIEKQAQKAANAATVTDKPKTKRKYTKSKTVMRWNTEGQPAAETPHEAAKLMLESKKLSDKVDYSKIQQLFTADDFSEPQEDIREALPSARKSAITNALDAKDRERQRGASQANDKWSRALEVDSKRRVSFLDSLSSAAAEKPGRLGSLRR